MSIASRPLRCCTFANEKSVHPKNKGDIFWAKVVALHEKRRLRPAKSGPMFGGYAIKGTRCNDNVLHRSLIQLDRERPPIPTCRVRPSPATLRLQRNSKAAARPVW